jgi:hypothetical protein
MTTFVSKVLPTDYSVINIMASPVVGTLLSLVFWLQVFLIVFIFPPFCSLNFKNSRKSKNLIVALIHDVGAFALPLAVLYREYHTYRIAGTNTPSQMGVLNFSVGYFLTDVLYWYKDGIYSHKWNHKTMIHHVTCLAGIGTCWSCGRGASDLHYGMILTHLNSPFGYVRYLAKQVGHEQRTYAKVCACMYTWTKLITILLVSPPVVLSMLINKENALMIKLCGLSILIVNLSWLHTAVTDKGRDYTV